MHCLISHISHVIVGILLRGDSKCLIKDTHVILLSVIYPLNYMISVHSEQC